MLEGTSSSSQTRSFYYWQWYTPFGHMFRAEARTEMTDMEIYTITSDYVSNYPDAGMVALASDRYNGNGYAWMINDPTAGSNNSATTSNSWLYDGGNSGNNLANMWSSTEFYEETTSSEAEKIYYGLSDDHSAIPSINQKYISKWGNGPLMEHVPDYCPYLSNNLKYLRIRTTPMSNSFSIDGPDSVFVNASNAYSFSPSPRGVTLSWSVENISSGSTSSFSFNSTTHSLCCYEPGAYVIHVEGYFGSNHVVTKQKIIVCYP